MVFMAAGSLTDARSQARNITAEEYIATYAPLAMKLQREYKIPASIKLAQGLFESDNGNSDLARRSNNHFGIKCKDEWKGEYVTHDDDKKGECFRKYPTIEDSYLDHAKFLAERPYYTALFKLDLYDYHGWAKGLQKAGYATADHYAESLIKLIDRYELYLFDEGEYPNYFAAVKPVTFLNLASASAETPVSFDPGMVVSVHEVGGHGIYILDGVRCVIARQGETYESLAKNLRIPMRRLMRFNGHTAGRTLVAGQVIYIENGARRS